MQDKELKGERNGVLLKGSLKLYPLCDRPDWRLLSVFHKSYGISEGSPQPDDKRNSCHMLAAIRLGHIVRDPCQSVCTRNIGYPLNCQHW